MDDRGDDPLFGRPEDTLVHAMDFDGTIYDADLGMNAAWHPDSDVLGYTGPDAFEDAVGEIRGSDDAISRGSELARIIERDGTGDLASVRDVLTEAQDPEDVKDGYLDLAGSLPEGSPMVVVTAGVEDGAAYLLDERGDDRSGVEGARLRQDPDGEVSVERYCGNREKPVRTIEHLSGQDADPEASIVSVGDSQTDSWLLKYARSTGGQAIAIEDGALPDATIDATADTDYQEVGTLQTVLDTLYREDDMEAAYEDGLAFAEDNGYDLSDEVGPTELANPITEQALAVYDAVVHELE